MNQDGLMLVSVKQQGPGRHVLEMLCSTNNQHFEQTGELSFGHLFVGQKKQSAKLLTQDGFGYLVDQIHKTMVTTVGLRGSDLMRVAQSQRVL